MVGSGRFEVIQPASALRVDMWSVSLTRLLLLSVLVPPVVLTKQKRQLFKVVGGDVPLNKGFTVLVRGPILATGALRNTVPNTLLI